MTFFDELLAHVQCCEIEPGSQDRLGNINWWCDQCDALLNEQPGFSDRYKRWTCRNCGYVNEISEDNIID